MANYTELSKIEFNSKHEYFLWRIEWKKTYKWLTEVIKGHKRKMKISTENNEHWHHQSSRECCRVEARWMMEILKNSKDKSWEMKKRYMDNNTDI